MNHLRKSTYTLSELISNLISELDITILGDPNTLITGVSTIQDAQPQHITFLTNPLYSKHLATTKASAVILTPDYENSCPVNALVTANPYYVYAKIAAFFDPRSLAKPGVHSSAVIGENCEIDSSASIGAKCVIGDAVKIGPGVVMGPSCVVGELSEIGEDSRFDANVTIYDRIKIGKRVTISSGAVIGSDGFGIAKHKSWQKVPQLGRVIIEDDVDIGANSCIDRGAIDDTLIARGAKLDNLIQVGHNVKIGENTAIAGCVAIAGSATIGKNCLIGGRAAINGHISIADNVIITGGTSVTKSIREPGMYSSGVFGVMTNTEWRKSSARFNRLENLMQRIKQLESHINQKSHEVNESEK